MSFGRKHVLCFLLKGEEHLVIHPVERRPEGFSMGPPEGSVLTFKSFFLSSKNLFFLPIHKEEEEEEGLECCLCLLRLLISWVKKEKKGIWLLSLFLEPKESHM